MTPKKGWGVRALRPIQKVMHMRKERQCVCVCVYETEREGKIEWPQYQVKILSLTQSKGEFVVEYVGEVISDEEAERRGYDYDQVKIRCVRTFKRRISFMWCALFQLPLRLGLPQKSRDHLLHRRKYLWECRALHQSLLRTQSKGLPGVCVCSVCFIMLIGGSWILQVFIDALESDVAFTRIAFFANRVIEVGLSPPLSFSLTDCYVTAFGGAYIWLQIWTEWRPKWEKHLLSVRLS